MADYKRMVSYMYQYENGIKRKNVGFVRVEAKGGQCKITLHMQLLGQLDSIFPTYLIQRSENRIELIYLGDTVLKNQVMDSKLSADENNIMGSGFALSEMGGLLLFLNDNIFFATEWDDKPIVAKDVMEALRPKSNTRTATKQEQSTKIFQAASNSQAQEEEARTLEEELSLPRYKLPGGFKMIERLQKEAKIKLIEEMNNAVKAKDYTYAKSTKPEIKAEKEAEDRSIGNMEATDKKAENRDVSYNNFKEVVYLKYEQIQGSNSIGAEAECQRPKDTESRKSTIIETEYMSPGEYKEKKINVIETESIREEEPQIAERDFIKEEGVVAEATENSAGKEDTLENSSIYQELQNAAAQELDGNLQADYNIPDHPTAKKIFDSYPRIYPFEDNEILLCVKIEPKDIGVLPKDLWPLSNNSFLLHGYYCYHHLIFAKMKNLSGYHYILGIPGIFHNREQFMARMFGFECFKSIRRRELKQGDFGYWYIPVYF